MECYLHVLINKFVYYVFQKLYIHLFQVLFMTPRTSKIIKSHYAPRVTTHTSPEWLSRCGASAAVIPGLTFVLKISLKQIAKNRKYSKNYLLQQVHWVRLISELLAATAFQIVFRMHHLHVFIQGISVFLSVRLLIINLFYVCCCVRSLQDMLIAHQRNWYGSTQCLLRC